MLKPVSFDALPDENLVSQAKANRTAMEVLISRYSRSVWSRARQFQGIVDVEDLAQEGFLGLMSAVKSYDAVRGVPFSAYAATCVRNRMISAVRGCCNLPLPVGDAYASPLSQVRDTSPLPDAIAESCDAYSTYLCTMVNCLSRREYQVCMLIMNGATYRQVAEQMHMSVKSVDNALQRARRKLRAEGV